MNKWTSLATPLVLLNMFIVPMHIANGWVYWPNLILFIIGLGLLVYGAKNA